MASMARRYLIVSDLHLADVEDHADGWKYFKASRYLYDEALDEVVDRFRREAAPDDQLTLVMNGDSFDFDLVVCTPDDPPWPVSGRERRLGLDPTEDKSLWKLERVLAAHRGFLEMLARFLAHGHQVVCVAGNHDPELHFDKVRDHLVQAIVAAGARLELAVDASRFRFEPWFYYVEGDVYVEHGHQYDYYSSWRYQLTPFTTTEKPRRVALPMGNISNRRMATKMGYFNPHAADFILNVFRYADHWLRHYAFSRRSLVYHWLFGSLRVLYELLRQKRRLRQNPPDHAAALAAEAERSGLGVETMTALDELKRQPITGRVYRMVREFWIDRLVLAVLMTGGTIALALVPIPLWIKLMVPLCAFPLLYLVYEWFAHGETIYSAEREALSHARQIRALLPVKVVTFGHSHVPEIVPIRPGTWYANTGTWAPILTGGMTGELRPGLRNTLLLVVDGERVEVRLDTHQR